MGSTDQVRGCRAMLSLRALAAAGMLTGLSLSTGLLSGGTPTAFAAGCATFTPAEIAQVAEEIADDAETDNGEPADPEVIAAAGSALANFVACWNAGDTAAVASLLSSNLITGEFGEGSIEDFIANLGDVPSPMHIVEADDVRVYQDGRVSVDVEFQEGEYSHQMARWFFADDNGQWRFDEALSLPPDVDGDKAFVSYSVADDASGAAFDQRSSITAPEVLVLHGFNNGESPRGFSIYALSAVPAEGEELTALPEDATLIGNLHIKGGDQEDYALVDLPAGAYALVAEGSDTPAVIVLTEPEM